MSLHSGSSQKVFLEVFLTPDHESIDIILLHFCFLALDSCLNHSHLLSFVTVNNVTVMTYQVSSFTELCFYPSYKNC